MKLSRLICFLFLIFFAFGVQARQMYVGNLEFEGKFRKTGSVKNDTLGAAVLVSPAELENMEGANLKSLSFHFLDVNSPRYFKLFVTNNLDSVSLYEKELDVTTIQTGWNEVALDDTLTITGDSLYLGYYMLSSASISQVVVNSYPAQSYFYKGAATGWSSLRGIAIFGTVEGDNLPGYDVKLSSQETNIDVVVNKTFDVAFCVENLAAETITSIDMECDYGNGVKDTISFDVEIPYLNSDSIYYENIVLEELGLQELVFTIIKLNGVSDENPNNNVHVINANVVERVVQRKVLLEVLSTEKCSACPKGHDIIESSIYGRHDQIIEVGHHIGFYTDQWTIPSDTVYMNFYHAAIVTSFAPAGMIDRTLMSREDGHDNPYEGGDSCVVFSVESADVWNMLNVALEKPAYAWIDLEVDFNESDSMLIINTAGKSVTQLGGEPRLTVYVTEDNLASTTQAGWNSDNRGPYYQHNVNRFIATDAWGDNVTLNEGFEKEYKVKVQPNWNVDNLNVVAFVHNYSTKPNVKERYTDFNVYNAEKVQVRAHEVAVEEVTDTAIMLFTRQDGQLEIVGEYQSGLIYNVSGQVVATLDGNPTTSIANISNGVYVVTLTLADGTNYHTKFLVTK